MRGLGMAGSGSGRPLVVAWRIPAAMEGADAGRWCTSVGRCAHVEMQVPAAGQEPPHGRPGHNEAIGQAFPARPSQWPVAFSR